MSTVRKVTLLSSDGVTFEIDEAVASESETIKHMVEGGCTDNGIPLANVTSKILPKVIEYCTKHVEAAAEAKKAFFASASSTAVFSGSCDEDFKSWESEFIKVDDETLRDLILASNYLSIPGLLSLSCRTVADMIKNKTPEECRQIFNIENDFTPEEEAEVRRDNEWEWVCDLNEEKIKT